MLTLYLRRPVDRQLSPKVFLPDFRGACHDDIRPKLDDVILLPVAHTGVHVIHGFVGDDEIGRAVREGDAAVLVARAAHDELRGFAREGREPTAWRCC